MPQKPFDMRTTHSKSRTQLNLSLVHQYRIEMLFDIVQLEQGVEAKIPNTFHYSARSWCKAPIANFTHAFHRARQTKSMIR